MRILDAWIHDPTKSGQIAVPEMCIQVDEMPDVTIEPEPFANGWVVGKYGPFIEYQSKHDGMTAVDFNSQFRDRFPMVIDIVLVVGEQTSKAEMIENRFSLPLSRARQLIKKHDPSWRLLISDREAVNGKLVWRPVETDAECRGDNYLCKQRPTSLVRIHGIDVPLCQAHIKKHNSSQAQARALSTSK